MGFVIAIDPSLTPGIAVWDSGTTARGPLAYAFTGKRPPKSCDDPQGQVGSDLWRFLYGGHDTGWRDVIDAVICETAFIGGYARATRSHSMLEGVIRAWCVTRAVRFIGIKPTELKRLASGSGRSDKSSMISTARLLFPGVRIDDDNQADALCLLHVGMSILKQESLVRRESPRKARA